MERNNVKVLEIIQQDRAVKDFLLYRARILRDEFGIESVFVCWKGDFTEEVSKEFKVVNVDFPRRPSLLRYLRAIRLIRNVIALEKPDIIHTHFTIPGLLGRIAAGKREGMKLVHQVHGYFFDRMSPGLKRSLSICLEKYLCRRHTDVILFQNTDNLRFASEHAFLKDGYFYLGNGIDLDEFDFRPKVKVSESPSLITIGRLEPVKNHLDIIRALAVYREKHGDNIRLDIVGEGSSQELLLAEVKHLELEELVRFSGRKENVKEFLQKSDCFVLSSLAEGKPRVIMESMATGVPIIASNVIGTRDLIEDGERGFLYDVGNFEDLADKIALVLRDRKLREKFVFSSRKYVEDNCNEKKVALTLGKLFLEIARGLTCRK